MQENTCRTERLVEGCGFLTQYPPLVKLCTLITNIDLGFNDDVAGVSKKNLELVFFTNKIYPKNTWVYHKYRKF